LTPEQVVSVAAQAGVQLLALTDHDTVDGVAEAARAAAQVGLRLVPAIEISAIDTSDRDLHILGYLIDPDDSELLDRLREYRGDRQRRVTAMARALVELGFELDDTEIRTRRDAGKSVGRPHLAQAVVNQPANASRLQDEGLNGPSAFLEAYLIEGRPAFCRRETPTIGEAITAIHDAGGVAVWAHPFWDIVDSREVLGAVDRFRAIGLDGVECFYPTHTREQAELLANHCEQLGLLTTGSSDFHGPHHRDFPRFRAFDTHGIEPVLGPIGD
jgi:predicted metal-dependent phosphoesterase TrpH